MIIRHSGVVDVFERFEEGAPRRLIDAQTVLDVARHGFAMLRMLRAVSRGTTLPLDTLMWRRALIASGSSKSSCMTSSAAIRKKAAWVLGVTASKQCLQMLLLHRLSP